MLKIGIALVWLVTGASVALAEKASPAKSPAPAKSAAPVKSPVPVRVSPATSAEEADVQKIREKYWARGNESEMGVVQNRLYPKRHRFELGISGGNLNGDPFLTVLTGGASLGFHFSEFFALHFLYWSPSVNPSSALKTLQNELNTTANTNEPKAYYGLDARASILYGKLSLLGAAILYFDSYLSIGTGQLKTESGTNLTVSGGFGQQIHLSRTFCINIDYRLIWYKERILGKVTGPSGNLGQDLGMRSNLSNAITLGFSAFINPFGG